MFRHSDHKKGGQKGVESFTVIEKEVNYALSLELKDERTRGRGGVG